MGIPDDCCGTTKMPEETERCGTLPFSSEKPCRTDGSRYDDCCDKEIAAGEHQQSTRSYNRELTKQQNGGDDARDRNYRLKAWCEAVQRWQLDRSKRSYSCEGDQY